MILIGVKSKKLNYIIQDSGATILISHASKASVVQDAVSELNSALKFIWVGDSTRLSQFFSQPSFSWDTNGAIVIITKQLARKEQIYEKADTELTFIDDLISNLKSDLN